jgi:hypothetical protein
MDNKVTLGRVEKRHVLLVPSDAEMQMRALAEHLQDHAASRGTLTRRGNLDPVASLRDVMLANVRTAL